MSADERALHVVHGWVQKAESDLSSAAIVLRAEQAGTSDVVVYHAQQCVEKYLKALLVSRDIDFPKTHDIGRLASLLPPDVTLDLSVEDQSRLTLYATATRYPGDDEPVSGDEARRAVAIARRIRERLRALLPPTVL